MFDGFDPSKYEDEAKSRWGDTDAYAESARRTKRYTKDDWAAIRAEARAITDGFASAMESGAPADDARVTAIAERHRQHIDRWFYPCAHAMHVGLGDMYANDPRFAAAYEQRCVGLADFVRRAIHANARQEKAGPVASAPPAPTRRKGSRRSS
jgi:hypothetical protein